MHNPVNACNSALTVVNARPEFDRAAAWLGDFCASAGLPNDVTARLLVVLDEVLNNVMTHMFADAPEGAREIELRARIEAGKVELEISDDGPAFDPTVVVPLPKAARIAERRQGGVGLLFVRTLMDEVRFIRQDERNSLTLSKTLAVTA